MTKTADSRRVTYLILRFMRRPIIVLVSIYAISMIGWTLVPGPGGAAGDSPMSLFHAFYFLAYTATTTGFGEIPHDFSEAQRMWAILSLYAGVVAWLYAIGKIIQLFQNPHFQQAMAEVRFARNVARLTEPFVIVCGFGNTGSLLTRGLSDAGVTAVILDVDTDRIVAIYLRDYRVAMHALVADARVPDRLIEAGLMRKNCRAVVALTADEELNLKIAVAARLLNPDARIITQSTNAKYRDALANLGGEIHIIDPFQIYARYLGATIHNPAVHMLNEWLIAVPGATLAMYPDIPPGHWILCGFGRLGRCIHDALTALGIETIVIDPTIDPETPPEGAYIADRVTHDALVAAGVQRAAGIVVGTNADPDNLSIVINARALNPDLFVLVRQNRHRNQVLFAAAEADLIMQPSLVAARRILFILIAPLLRTFFTEMQSHLLDDRDHVFRDTITILHDRVGHSEPRLWTVRIDDDTAPALMRQINEGVAVTLAEITRDPTDRERSLPCVPLVVRTGDTVKTMPPDDHVITAGTEILLCGHGNARRLIDANLHNDYTLHYLITGVDAPRGYVMQWLDRQWRGRKAANTA